ncbi:hypothetical protein ACBQ24_12090 [Acinetobacter terrestris]|uniref:hypothetical protein n=1 Tax=Acinetobacter terrestris TaxID=2529843 RepID=UPI003526582A
MARARNIKPSFFLNEDIVELPCEARLLFIGLWTLADREGRLENRPKKIKMSLFPADDINVSEQLSNISKFGFIELYNADDTDVIQITNFVKHQTPHGLEKDSELPDQNGVYTVYFRNPKNKTVTGKPLYLKQDQLADFYAKTGEFSPNTPNQGTENSFQASNNEAYNDVPIVSEQDNNSYQTVSISDQNALNPESFNLNPDSLNPKIVEDERFVFELSLVNTKIKMRGLKEISQEDLNKLQGDLQAEYGHKNQMVKNQVLGKLVQWVERRQQTPLNNPEKKSGYSSSEKPNRNVNDAWNNIPEFQGDVTPVEIPEDFV